MGMNENFRFLSIGLPGDIERRKQFGDFEGAVRLIDQRLQQNVPEALKKCMLAEREMILRTEADYPYNKAQALARIRKDIPGFTEEEFDEFVDKQMIAWIYVRGEERYIDSFYSTLLKVYPDFAKRAGKVYAEAVETPEGMMTEKMYEQREIDDMKKNGTVSWRFRLRAAIKVDDDKFVPGKTYRAWLPIPSPKARQISDVEIIAHSDVPCVIAAEDAPQRTIFFETRLEENREFFVEYAYTDTVSYVDAYHGKGKPGRYDFDLEEIQPHVVFSPYMRELVKTLTEGVEDPLEKARIFYDFVTKTVRYSFMPDYFCMDQIAENCARNLRGDCGVQALLFITLCRCAGIPARWQSGRTATPLDTGMHDWAEFYVEPYGWLFADPSYGGGAHRAGEEERRQFYFGNLDPFRMIANTEYQQEFTPASEYWRQDPYDNQAGEMEYADGPMDPADYSRHTDIVSFEKLK